MIHCVPTPQSIRESESGRNVFQEIVPATDLAYLKKRDALWARFQYRGIGSCDIDYWVACMKDRYAQIKERYDLRFNAWTEWLQEIHDDGIEWSSGSETTIINQDTTGDSTTVGEDFPDTRIPTGTPEFLTDRTTTDSSGTLDNTTTRSRTDGIQPEQVSRWMEAVPNPSDDFAREFDDYFHWAIR